MASRKTQLAFSAFVIGLGTACAQDDERRRLTGPTKPPSPPEDPEDELPEEGAWVDVGCEPGDIRTCKVTIDENNCFVGEQRCEYGQWSECLDPNDFEDPTGSVG